jgi:hypothetical protein
MSNIWTIYDNNPIYDIGAHSHEPYNLFLQKYPAIDIEKGNLAVGSTFFEVGTIYKKLGQKKSKNAMYITFEPINPHQGIIYEGEAENHLLFSFWDGFKKEPVINPDSDKYTAAYFCFGVGIDELIVSRPNQTVRVIRL